MKRIIQVLMLAPGEEPRKTELSTSEYSLRKAVNIGNNQNYKPECRRIEDDICVLFNRGFSSGGFTPNRCIADDILCGTVYIAGIHSNGTLRSLTDEEMQKYTSAYQIPETYSHDDVLNANLNYVYNTLAKRMESRDIAFVYG